MPRARTISIDPLTRSQTVHHFDHSTGKTYIEEKQDVSHIIKRNKELQNWDSYQAAQSRNEYKHIATIPNNVIIKLKKEYGIDVFNNDDLPRLERLLMSNEFKYLRTVDKI